jgi:hypothetical protein
MARLSQHFAALNFFPGDVTVDTVSPISVNVTVDEAWSPYVQATAVIRNEDLPSWADPREGIFVGLRLQQDFGDLLYVRDLTEAFGGSVAAITAAYTPVRLRDITRDFTQPWNVFEPGLPLSTITAAYGGDISQWTSAGFGDIWVMSDFLHEEGSFNPAPSTVFEANLMLRTVEKDYVSGQTTLRLESHESFLQDARRFKFLPAFGTSFTSLRDLINYTLSGVVGAELTLEPGLADYTFSPALDYNWKPEVTAWDYIDSVVKQANLVFYCDEAGKFRLEEPEAVLGELTLTDDSNITALKTVIDRDNPRFFQYAFIEYRNENVITGGDADGSASTYSKHAYFVKDSTETPLFGAAFALVSRGSTRGEIFDVEAISDYNARPRQTLTIDVEGEPLRTAIIQSINWALPADRMTLEIRDIEEVI